MRKISSQHANQALSMFHWEFRRINFFNCRRRSRACFDENEWTFKIYNYTALYMFVQIFYMWNLLYIKKSNDERSSFTVINYVEFMKNSQSWSFVRRKKKKFVIRSLLFFDSILRFSDVKTASRLTHINLTYMLVEECE
jgi:hypothetical protein